MTLYLLPNLLGPSDPTLFFPNCVGETVKKLHGLIAEDEKEGRAYLKLFGVKPQNFPIKLLNEHTKPNEIDVLLEPIVRGESWGIVSDCGLPCIADPGSNVVLRANQKKIAVQTFVGPSSIVMALQLSGLSGQRFAFHGYISRDDKATELKKWEKRAFDENETQIFMDAPYRNASTLQKCLEILDKKVLFAVATDLTLSSQEVRTMTVSEWRTKEFPSIDKRPTLFLFANMYTNSR